MTSRFELKYLKFLAVALLAIPFITKGSYALYVINLIGIYFILAIAFDLLFGYGGQISLGQAAFFGWGAYLSGIISTKLGFSPWISLPISVCLTGLVAFIVGFPMLRLKGFYLAVGTYAFLEISMSLFIGLPSLTGGTGGLGNIPAFQISHVKFASDENFFYVVYLFAALSLVFSRNLVRSSVGRDLRALAEDEDAASVMSVNISWFKIRLFVLHAVLSGLAGTLYAHYTQYISPPHFDFSVSIEVILIVALGGKGTLLGGLIGACLLKSLPELIVKFQDYQTAVYGFLLMVILLYFPSGILGGIMEIRKKLFGVKMAGLSDSTNASC